MARTYQQMLDANDALIAELEGSANQQLSVAGRTAIKQQLAPLYAERARLVPLAAKETRGGRDIRRIAPFG